MSKTVDAVMDALRVVLEEAEAREDQDDWHTSVVNRWIARLPGAWYGRWRQLILRADCRYTDTAERENLISHVKATLAYLQTCREKTASSPSAWLFRRSESPTASKPSGAKIIVPGNRNLH